MSRNGRVKQSVFCFIYAHAQVWLVVFSYYGFSLVWEVSCGLVMTDGTQPTFIHFSIQILIIMVSLREKGVCTQTKAISLVVIPFIIHHSSSFKKKLIEMSWRFSLWNNMTSMTSRRVYVFKSGDQCASRTFISSELSHIELFY